MRQPLAQSTPLAGLRLALSMFTVVPVRVHRIDRQTGGVAMALAPAVGAALGAALGAAGVAVTSTGAAPMLAATVVVALGALLTRGLHLDGLADTADGLGSYRDRQGALDIMKKSDIGPFGVVSIVLVLLLQAAALAAVLARPPLAAVTSVAVAMAGGRVAVTLACRRGVPAARESGLGALVAGTVTLATAMIAAVGVGLLAISAVPATPWQGPAAVLVALVAATGLTRHAVRRLGGVTGDVLGALVELTGTITLLGLALGQP